MSYQVLSIHQSDRVVRFLATHVGMASFAEIASATGVGGAGLTRILASLKAVGQIEEPASQRWCLAADFAALMARPLDGRLEQMAREVSRIIEGLQRGRNDG